MSGGPGQDKASLPGLGGQGYANENSGASRERGGYAICNL